MRKVKNVLILFAGFLSLFLSDFVVAAPHQSSHRHHRLSTSAKHKFIHKSIQEKSKRQKNLLRSSSFVLTGSHTSKGTMVTPMGVITAAAHRRHSPSPRLRGVPLQKKKNKHSHALKHPDVNSPAIKAANLQRHAIAVSDKTVAPIITKVQPLSTEAWQEPIDEKEDIARTVAASPKTQASQQVFLRTVDLLKSLRSTRYEFGGNYMDENHGVYKVDCSGYVNRVFENADVSAFNELMYGRNTDRPMSSDYYQFLNAIPHGGARNGWYRPAGVGQLQPGDIIVYRSRARQSGHVMIVMEQPKRDKYQDDVYHVRISDSASSGHTADTRGHGSGVGIGTLMVRVKSLTDIPYQLAWKDGAHWERNMDIVLGRVLR